MHWKHLSDYAWLGIEKVVQAHLADCSDHQITSIGRKNDRIDLSSDSERAEDTSSYLEIISLWTLEWKPSMMPYQVEGLSNRRCMSLSVITFEQIWSDTNFIILGEIEATVGVDVPTERSGCYVPSADAYTIWNIAVRRATINLESCLIFVIGSAANGLI